eukprot:2342755-Pyramimonas_sp.AAC.1
MQWRRSWANPCHASSMSRSNRLAWPTITRPIVPSWRPGMLPGQPGTESKERLANGGHLRGGKGSRSGSTAAESGGAGVRSARTGVPA